MKEVWTPLNLRNIFFQNMSIENTNLKHKYEATKVQLIRKVNEAQSFRNKRPIPPKEIGSQV